jgi:hypothetical protein
MGRQGYKGIVAARQRKTLPQRQLCSSNLHLVVLFVSVWLTFFHLAILLRGNIRGVDNRLGCSVVCVASNREHADMPTPFTYAVFVPVIAMTPKPFPDYPYTVGPFATEAEAEAYLNPDRVGLYPILRMFSPHDLHSDDGRFSPSPHDHPELV